MVALSLAAAVLIVLSVALVVGLLFFIFYPAIVDRNQDDSSRQRRPEVTTLQPSSSSAAADPAAQSATTATPILSVIIPAYEEEVRLPHMLLDAYTYLSSTNCTALTNLSSLRQTKDAQDRRPLIVEWIVVNDGSKDNTSQSYRDFIDQHVKDTSTAASSSLTTTRCLWKLIVLPKNRGKGAAVRTGMLAATGDYCLMVDADGATDFRPGLDALSQRLVDVVTDQKQGSTSRSSPSSSSSSPHAYPILLGSRAHLQKENASAATNDQQQEQKQQQPQVARSLIRSLLMYAFHVCVVVLIGANNVRDTQCGFKLLHRSTAATILFGNLHLKRWAFDTELLFLATQLQYDLVEVVVPWHDVEGSKLHTSALNLALVSIGMLRDMACVRLCYTLGLWKIRPKVD